MWWRMFERHEMTVEQRWDDRECLANLTRTSRAPWRIQRSNGFEYRFDRAQETKLGVGDSCHVAGTDFGAKIVAMDDQAGLLELKTTDELPDRLCLIPDEYRQGVGRGWKHILERTRREAEAES